MNNKLNVLLSDLVVFYHELQNKHWYVSGQSFFQIHPELENLYDAVLPQVDTVGELILMNGGKPVSTLKEFLANAKIEEGTDAYVTSVKTLYSELLPDYQYLLKSVTEIKEAADAENNYLVSAKMDEFIASYAKTIWMLNQALL